MRKRILSMILLAAMTLTLLSGCGGQPQTSGGSVSSSGSGSASSAATSEETQPPVKKEITVVSSNVTTLSPFMANSAENSIMQYTQGRLYNFFPKDDRSGSVLTYDLAAAEPVDVNGDGLVWKIAVDPNAKWDNGDPITAETFEYSFKMILDPKLLCTQANMIAKNVVTIKNATEYYKGEAVAWEDVGIKATDEYTLEITLTQIANATEVMRHFASYWGSPVHPEMFEASLNADRTSSTYGTEVANVRFSGAFVVDKWVKGSNHILTRNTNYLRQEDIKLDIINMPVVGNTATGIQLFNSGKLDIVSLDASSAAQYSESPLYMQTYSRYVQMIEFCDTNTEMPILANINFKKALFHAIDRATLAKTIRTVPADFAIPYTSVVGSGTAFRDLPEVKEYMFDNYGYDPTLAKQYMDKALQEENMTSVTVNLIHTSGGADETAAEFLQEQLAQVFGADRFTLTLEGVPNSARLSTIKSCKDNPNAYQLAFACWSIGATDTNPVKVFETMTSTYGRRNAPYHSDKLDQLFIEGSAPEVRVDMDKLIDYAMQLEKVFLEECISVPMYETTNKYLVAERVIMPWDEPDTTLGFGTMFCDVE